MADGDPIIVPAGTGVDGDTGWGEVQVQTDSLNVAVVDIEAIESELPKAVTKGWRAFEEAALVMDGFASKAALAEVLDQWETKTNKLPDRCQYLRTGLKNAADAYAFVDGNNAVGISGVGELVEREP